MAEELLEAEAVEEIDTGVPPEAEAEPVRPLPEPASGAELASPGPEVRTAALAAAGGLVAGAATVAMVRAVTAGAGRAGRGGRLARKRAQHRPVNIVASRSFLVDIHMLGK